MSENNEQLPVTSEKIPQDEKSQASVPTSFQDAPKLEASATLTHPSSPCSDATRGVRPPRGDVSQVLHGAAKKAAHSNSRNDVHEYMRLRRNYV